ncbi:hypothetical protein F2Q69_00022382 [Brassica cretica]|uniref:Uncharacterized protein n=1 Tax=Brassica cretica TaxID=69181 RepID=A0A8S9QBI2_BRACR|nr:hypothetical protein F2Q69_00022382 [Brassica cretica]
MNSPTKDPWTFVSGPKAVYNPEVFYRTRRSCGNPESLDTEIVSGPGGPGGHLGTRRFLQTLRSYLGPRGRIRTQRSFGNPEVPSDPEVVFRTRRSYLGPEGRLRTRRSFGNPKVPSNPEVVFGTRRPGVRKDPKYLVLQGPYSAFLGKTTTGLEGAGVGVMTQVPGFAAFHVWRSRILIAPCISRNWHDSYDASCVRVSVQYFALYVICSLPEWNDAWVGAGASLNRNLEARVLPEAWMIFPNKFALYFSISSSNSENNLCTQVNWSCSFSVGFPWAGHRSSNPSFPVGINIGLSMEGPLDFTLIDLGRSGHLALHVDWTARLIRLAGEDHLYMLKSAISDLLPRSEAGILDLRFALK